MVAAYIRFLNKSNSFSCCEINRSSSKFQSYTSLESMYESTMVVGCLLKVGRLYSKEHYHRVQRLMLRIKKVDLRQYHMIFEIFLINDYRAE